MNQRIKIFIVEYDCVNLITLMLWLDQYPEFEVLGATVDTGDLSQQIKTLSPDVVLLDVNTPGPEDINQLKAVKSVSPTPAVVLLYSGEHQQVEGILKEQSDGALNVTETLKTLYETVVSAHNQRVTKIFPTPTPLPIAV